MSKYLCQLKKLGGGEDLQSLKNNSHKTYCVTVTIICVHSYFSNIIMLLLVLYSASADPVL